MNLKNLFRALIATIALSSHTATADVETHTSYFLCDEHLVGVDYYYEGDRFYRCQVNFGRINLSGGYCDEHSARETPYTAYGIAFDQNHLLTKFKNEWCILLP